MDNLEMLEILGSILPPLEDESSFHYATRARTAGIITVLEAYKLRSRSFFWHKGRWITGDEFSEIRWATALI